MTAIQSDLLDTARELIKPDGIIVYSTCTVEYAENQGMVERFLERHTDMENIPLPQLTGNEKLAIEDNTLQVFLNILAVMAFLSLLSEKKLNE